MDSTKFLWNILQSLSLKWCAQFKSTLYLSSSRGMVSFKSQPGASWAGDFPTSCRRVFRCWSNALAILPVYMEPLDPVFPWRSLLNVLSAAAALPFERWRRTYCHTPIFNQSLIFLDDKFSPPSTLISSAAPHPWKNFIKVLIMAVDAAREVKYPSSTNQFNNQFYKFISIWKVLITIPNK